MKKNFYLKIVTLIISFTLIISIPVLGKSNKPGFIKSNMLTKRVLIIKCINDIVAAVNTKKGIVVIDSGRTPSLSKKFKKIIQEKFGHSNFKYLINTHHHGDHTKGNQVFKNIEIIAHINAFRRMRENEIVDKKKFKTSLKKVKERIKRQNSIIDTLDKDSDLYKKSKEKTYISRLECDDLETIFQITLPTITFSDNLTLDMGDLNIELLYFGTGFHSDSDIIISIPEEKIVFTGDLVGEKILNYNSKSDFNPWIFSLDNILLNNNKLKNVVTTHYGVLSGNALLDFHNSLKKMRDEKNKKRNAVDNLRSMIKNRGINKALQEFEKQFLIDNDNAYYLWEADLVALAIEFNGQEKSDEAILILKMCEKVFPTSITTLLWKGFIYNELGEKQRALDAFKKAYPNSSSYFFYAASVYPMSSSK